MKLRVKCPICGFHTDFTEEDIKRYKELHQGSYSIPIKIECGKCRNNGEYSLCTQEYIER